MSDSERMITVKVLPANSRAIEIPVKEGSTVRDVIREAGVSFDKAASILDGDGASITLDSVVTDSQTIAIGPKIIGG